MLKRLLLVTITFLSSVSGYYQSTRIDFEGINELCYATLLSSKTVSGSWSSEYGIDLYAPEEIKEFFKSYKDDGRFFYLNYFQDVSGGYLLWPYYPPEEFKILLYFPESKQVIVSDESYQRYALTSPFKAVVSNGKIQVTRNYDYPRFFLIMLVRILAGVASAMLVSYLFWKPIKSERKYYWITNIIFHCFINILISMYSFYNGFGLGEYIGGLWLLYILFFVIQGAIYKAKVKTVSATYLCACFSNIVAYFVGFFLIDVFPQLFTIF